MDKNWEDGTKQHLENSTMVATIDILELWDERQS